MSDSKINNKSWANIPPWIILGSLVTLVPIFVYWTIANIHRQKKDMILLQLEKGAALIRSFEAGARTGMMGSRRQKFRFQKLLMETAQQPDIIFFIVTDTSGNILAHNEPLRIGETHGKDLDLDKISRSENLAWRQISRQEGDDIFEVFRRFSPNRRRFPRHWGGMMPNIRQRHQMNRNLPGVEPGRIIFAGFDMGPINAATREDIQHTVIMAAVLLLIGFSGIFLLFLAQAYRSATTSLTRIKAFSDNVVENMPIGLLAIGGDKKIISLNRTAESVLHLSSHELLGKSADKVLPEPLWALTDKFKAGESIIENEIEYPLADGKKVPLDVSVSLLEVDSEIFPGYMILFRDLTEIQYLKREIERSRRLASLGRLAAGIAHEIRNPLSSIKGFATYFRDRYRDEPEDRKTAEIMIQEVERLNRVISQLLEFARPMAIQKQSVSIHAVIQHSLDIIEKAARTKDIRINESLSSDIKDISIDPDKIKQVLLNLYLNALEAMGNGGSLSIELKKEEISGRKRLSVSDTGKGINKDDIEHVFDPYFTTKPSGTGLGLAIVHSIIEAHEGEVYVESEVDEWTTVTILLP